MSDHNAPEKWVPIGGDFGRFLYHSGAMGGEIQWDGKTADGGWIGWDGELFDSDLMTRWCKSEFGDTPTSIMFKFMSDWDTGVEGLYYCQVVPATEIEAIVEDETESELVPTSAPVAVARDTLADFRAAKQFAKVCGGADKALVIANKIPPDVPPKILSQCLAVLAEE